MPYPFQNKSLIERLRLKVKNFLLNNPRAADAIGLGAAYALGWILVIAIYLHSRNVGDRFGQALSIFVGQVLAVPVLAMGVIYCSSAIYKWIMKE